MGPSDTRVPRGRLLAIAFAIAALAIFAGTSQAGSVNLPESLDDVVESGENAIECTKNGKGRKVCLPVDDPGDHDDDGDHGHGDHSHGDEDPDDHAHGSQDDFEAFGGRDGAKSGPRAKGKRRAVRAAPRGASDNLLGLTTLERTIDSTGDPADGFQTLFVSDGEPRILREDLASAKKGRANRRKSLLYVAQTTDWQLVDEESPSRVELLDIGANPPFPSTISAAWRPQEAFGPQSVEQSIRQINQFTEQSPHKQRNGDRAAMDMVLMTGDQADNMQFNETDWVQTLLEGGTLDPNSGTDPSSCPPLQMPVGQTADPALYAGVQDFDDYTDGQQFYDPDEPGGPKYSDWPIYTGLMDRAQEPFVASGLNVPSYLVFGNHDGLAQGNQAALAPFEAVGVGCIKPMVPVTDLTQVAGILDPVYLAGLIATNPSQLMFVPPDPDRRYVNRVQFKDIFQGGSQPDGHGFDLVDPDELADSNGAASYYAFDKSPAVRMIAIDTLCDGGVTGPSASGNIDDPQWQWLESELQAATDRDQLIVVFGHHPVRSLTCPATDETSAAPPCTIDDSHGHDINPGCDLDPRNSSPIHDGGDLTDLFHEYPHVIAYIAGHTHENTLSEFDNPSGGAGDFWGIETASLIDWPPQNRLIELMDNCDGTLSFLGTTIDNVSPAQAPAPDLPPVANRRQLSHADDFTEEDLASISRTLSYNDPQAGPAVGGQGEPADRNVELLLEDPRPEPSPCTQREGDDDDDPGDDDGGPGDGDEPTAQGPGGSLPFTGLALLGLLIAALALFASGGLTRWASRFTK